MSHAPLRRALPAALALALFHAPTALLAQPGPISTLPAWDGSAVLSGIGLPGSSAVGQTFLAPTQAAMTGFSVHLSGDYLSSNPGGLLFRGYLMEWNGTHAVGPALYESGVRVGEASLEPARYDFDFAAPVQLAGGGSYVFFLSRLGLAEEMGEDPDATNRFGFVRDAYAEGTLVYFNIEDQWGDDPSRLTQDPWTVRPDIDYAFEARFDSAITTTPEPATFALAGGGLLLLGAARAARRRRAS